MRQQLQATSGHDVQATWQHEIKNELTFLGSLQTKTPFRFGFRGQVSLSGYLELAGLLDPGVEMWTVSGVSGRGQH